MSLGCGLLTADCLPVVSLQLRLRVFAPLIAVEQAACAFATLAAGGTGSIILKRHLLSYITFLVTTALVEANSRKQFVSSIKTKDG